jgi:hypothetical protein
VALTSITVTSIPLASAPLTWSLPWSLTITALIPPDLGSILSHSLTIPDSKNEFQLVCTLKEIQFTQPVLQSLYD